MITEEKDDLRQERDSQRMFEGHKRGRNKSYRQQDVPAWRKIYLFDGHKNWQDSEEHELGVVENRSFIGVVFFAKWFKKITLVTLTAMQKNGLSSKKYFF